MESAGEARGAVPRCSPGGSKGRDAVAGSARALSEHREDIPHRTRERGEGFQLSLVVLLTVTASERGEGFQYLLPAVVTETPSERGEGFRYSLAPSITVSSTPSDTKYYC